jgi:hypothetical protein
MLCATGDAWHRPYIHFYTEHLLLDIAAVKILGTTYGCQLKFHSIPYGAWSGGLYSAQHGGLYSAGTGVSGSAHAGGSYSARLTIYSAQQNCA